MNNIVLERIQSQIGWATPKPSVVQTAYNAIKQVTISPPISLEELRSILMSELDAPKQVEKSTVSESVHFDNIYDFTTWYADHQTEFTKEQRDALDTLLATRQSIETGCACRRAAREHSGGAYFAQFWTNNAKTDLLPTIAKITGASRVTINTYCSYPVPVE